MTVDPDRLAQVAAQLAARVRDDEPDANARWLLATTSADERWALLFVLAAAVPDDRPWRQLVLWTDTTVNTGGGQPDTPADTVARQADSPRDIQRRREILVSALAPRRARKAVDGRGEAA
jgi:hypothetical protein